MISTYAYTDSLSQLWRKFSPIFFSPKLRDKTRNRKPGFKARVSFWALGARLISLIVCTNESLDLTHVRSCMRQLGIISQTVDSDKPCC